MIAAALVTPAGAAPAEHGPVPAGGHPAGAAEATASPRMGGRGTLGASGAFDADGTLWVVSLDGEHVVLRRSADEGRSWSDPILVNADPEPIAADGESRPKLALGPKGEIYVSWTRPLAKPYTGEIRFARSLDRGRTFGPPLTVHSDRQEITHRFDALEVAKDGRIVVAWIDKRDLVAAKAAGREYRGAAVYYSVSSDRGATFGPDRKLADHCCECCRLAVRALDDGRVAVLWRHVFDGDIRDHAYAEIGRDGLPGAMQRATFENWKLNGCPHHGPSLAVDRQGRLHAVWYSGVPGDEGIRYGRLRVPGEGAIGTSRKGAVSAAGGVDELKRVGGPLGKHADLLVEGATVVVAWRESDGDRLRLMAMRSDDGGENWRSFELASTAGAGDQPRLVGRSGRSFVLWNTVEEPLGLVRIPG